MARRTTADPMKPAPPVIRIFKYAPGAAQRRASLTMKDRTFKTVDCLKKTARLARKGLTAHDQVQVERRRSLIDRAAMAALDVLLQGARGEGVAREEGVHRPADD